MKSKSFDLNRALMLAAMCGQTYNQFYNEDGSFLTPRRYSLVHNIKAKSFQSSMEKFGFVLESEKSIIVAFRGTGTATDWASDIIARQIDYPYRKNSGLTHKGFTDIYKSARPQLLQAMAGLPHHKPVYITGHSLGGALSTLAAPDIQYTLGRRKVEVYTFAAPRVGDPRFASHYNRTIPVSWRIRNINDVVPYLPPVIYRLPRGTRTYFYMHVKGDYPLDYNEGSVSGNHKLGGYFKQLAELDPVYAANLCGLKTGWCPA